MDHRSCRIALSALLSLGSVSLAVDELKVIGVEPGINALARRDTAISVHFDRPVRRETVTDQSFWAMARWSGAVTGEVSFSNDDRTITLSPDSALFAADQVLVILSHDVVAVDGSPMRQGGFSFGFSTRVAAARLDFVEIDQLSTRTSPSIPSRAYGGFGADLNHDGWSDISIVNEISADLRVFLNRADGTGLFHDFIQPTFALEDRASPSETADFNRDGHTDCCVANLNTDSVSILLGNGDGTFQPQTIIPVGDFPRGIVVLDADGDGDLDVVNTNANASNLAIMLNDGQGSFSTPTFFDGGGTGEWALAAADMNRDGIIDLVVGARFSADVHVLMGNGDGTFTPAASRPCGGAVWSLACADFNDDGWIDVATANSNSNNGAILLNDGAGGLNPPVTFPGMAFPISTDLGDLDGDGDVDWIVSCFSGGWRLYRNDGAGGFTFDRTMYAQKSGSCSIVLDVDNDRRADLALIDENEDVVFLNLNACYADCDDSGVLDLFDFLCFVGAFNAAGAYADCDGDGERTLFDFLCFINDINAGCP